MKENQQILKIFPLSSPLMFTELLALLGDKYNSALSFQWQITHDFSSAQVVLWDGVVTLKNQGIVKMVLDKINPGRVLLFVNGSTTFLQESMTANVANLDKIPLVEVKGWNVLPEELLSAIEACEKKLKTYV